MSPRFGHQNNVVSNHLCGSPESRHLTIKCFCTNVYSIVPVVGMLCANAITGISVSLDYILKELKCVIYPAPIGRVSTSLVAAAKSAILQRPFLVHRSLRHIVRS